MKLKTGSFHRKNVAFKTESVDPSGTFKGYASVYGVEDSYGEIVDPGAFTKSIKALKSSGRTLPALWQHQSDQPIGGYDVLTEDDHGLACEGFLMIDEIPLAKQAHALMKRGIVTGLSIGYYVEEYLWNEKAGELHLTQLNLVEISPVTFPANPDAQIEAVKAATRDGRMPSLKEFEEFLRDAGGFSKMQARVIASKGMRPLLSGSESRGDIGSDLLGAFKAFDLPSLNFNPR